MFKASQSLLRFGPKAFHASRPSTALARSKPLSLVRSQQSPLQVARFASKSDDKEPKDPPPPPKPIDREAEWEIAQKKLEPRPSEVSSDSTTTRKWDSTVPVMTSPGTGGETSLDAGLKHDLNIVKDTFSLAEVPREANALGLAGTIPYVATSLSTIFLAWDLGKELPTGNALYDTIFVNHETAEWLLHLLEPIQLGYGAVIISFLGAIHWGLEFAEKQPDAKRTRFRYGMGLASSIAAWPTLFMPFEYALTTQWAAFVGLYFADARAQKIGWAPKWYGVYRFLLTAIVGFAILVSLVGRASMSQHGRLSEEGISSSLSKAGLADTHTNWAELEKKEKEKIKKEKEEAERKAKKEAAEKKKQEKKTKNSEKEKEKAKGGEQAAKEESQAKSEGKDKSQDGDDKKADQEEKKDDDSKDQDKDKDESSKQQGDKGEEKSEEKSNDKNNEEKEESDDAQDKDSDKEESQDKKDDGKEDDDKKDEPEAKDSDDKKEGKDASKKKAKK